MTLEFSVSGNPVPKQSFRYGRTSSHADARVVDWQNIVRVRAREAANLQGFEKIDPPAGVSVQITFTLADKRKRDIDNLCKAVLDALKGYLFEDDDQVVFLTAEKQAGNKPGIRVKLDEV